MKSFLRENPTLAFGLGLPLLLIVVFLLISGVPSLLVAPPQYPVIYATDYFNNSNGVRISVVEQQVQVVYQGKAVGYRTPRLWRYNPETGGVTEIGITLPAGLVSREEAASIPGAESEITPIDVPDLAGLTIDASSIAPDGYEFNTNRTRYTGDIFTGLFGSSRYTVGPVLTKNGRSIRLPNTDGGRYYQRYVRFIGWVVSP